MTIEEAYLKYINYISLKNKITTVSSVKRKFKNYIIPFFCNKKITEITKNDFIEFQLNLKKLNYSNSFYHEIMSVCNGFFKYLNLTYGINNIANEVGRIVYNKNEIKKNNNIWLKKDFKKFIKCVDNNIYHTLFTVLFYTGIRKGEALALKVSDFKNNSLVISKTLTKEFYNGKRQAIPTKSGKTRIIPLDLFTIIEIKKLIKYYSKNYENFNQDFYLFGADEPIATTTLDRKKDFYCKKSGVKQIRIHDFRHSHATMLYNKKTQIKLIQERLGHADISTTMNIYVHTNEVEQKRLIKKINLSRL